MTTQTTGLVASAGDRRRDQLSRIAVPGLLLIVGIVGHFAVPGGPARAVFLLPCLAWVPGRSIVAAFGLGPRVAGPLVSLLSVMFSFVALIVAGLLTNPVMGHVPLATLPLWVSGVLLPLNLLERDPRPGPRAMWPQARRAVLFTGAFVVSAALLWITVLKLPTTTQQPYLTFYLSGSYTHVQGEIAAKPGERLEVPVAVGGAGDESVSGLTVVPYIDYTRAGLAVPVQVTGQNSATALVGVTLPTEPEECVHRIGLVLEHGSTQLRTVDLYVREGQGATCGGG